MHRTMNGKGKRSMITALVAVGTAGCVLIPGWIAGASAGSDDAASRYSVLKRPATADDALPNQRYTVAKIAEGMPINPEAARLLTRTAAGKVVELLPRSDGKICLHVVNPDGSAGGACPDTSEVLADGAVAGQPGAQVGVVPDGVASVSVTLSDGSTTTVAVKDNVFEAPKEGVSASFDGQRDALILTPWSASSAARLQKAGR